MKRPSGIPLIMAFCLFSTWAMASVRLEIVSISAFTENASSANSSSPRQSRRGQSASPQCSRACRTHSVIFVSGFSSIRLWTQKMGSTSSMPTTVTKSVNRPMAAPAAFENVCGSDTDSRDTGRPAMSRMVYTASNGFSPSFQNPPE